MVARVLPDPICEDVDPRGGMSSDCEPGYPGNVVGSFGSWRCGNRDGGI